MPTIFVIIFALAILGTNQCFAQTCPVAANATCDMATLGCCDKNLRTTLNLTGVCDGSGTFADPFCYRDYIEGLYVFGGVQALIQVCGAFNTFKSCLGDMMEDCMRYPFYMKNGYPRTTALRTEVLYSQMQFACGAGMDSFIYNENCMPQTWNASIPDLQKCRNQFVESEPSGPCPAMTIFLGCVQKPFVDKCTRESAWWMCEYSRVTSHIYYPQCRGNCIL